MSNAMQYATNETSDRASALDDPVAAYLRANNALATAASSHASGRGDGSGNPTGAVPKTATPSAGRTHAEIVSKLETDLRNPNVQAFLSTVAQAEGATYNTRYGKGTFSDYSHFPTYRDAHTPSGRYQITADTYRRLSAKLGLTDFSPHTQDLMAAQLLAERGAMGPLLSGNLDAALSGASVEWAALPKGPNSSNRYPHQPYMS